MWSCFQLVVKLVKENKQMTNKQKIKIHVENKIEGVEIQINTLEEMIKNLDNVRHYKNIDKRFLDKLMTNTPKDNKGFDIMYITTKSSYGGIGFDIELWGRHQYQIERPLTRFEQEHEPDQIFFNNHTIDLGFRLFISGDNSLDYEPTDNPIVRLEKSLISQLEHKKNTKLEIIKSLENLDDNLEKIKEYGEMLLVVKEKQKQIDYYTKNAFQIAVDYSKSPLDLYLDNTLAIDIEK